jgi:secreted trypsin-like serine protease
LTYYKINFKHCIYIGGPLVVQADDGRWNLIGLASFGMGCGEGAYTRASGFLNWMNTTIQSN